eukprot:CAMPEP_0185700138 /NCGR_PEP_ID=MMETSP1164-20130828/7319_1 /TAXON_ID=1104430 /ORGANISM="Chrysoreinhardia sp, Strain CCMP2950" /LENGTH=455 /DNA_ID=CAMNT_0028367087 /DNA_START=60 /DNA_END=1427 /DNA_ORIENTATION=+
MTGALQAWCVVAAVGRVAALVVVVPAVRRVQPVMSTFRPSDQTRGSPSGDGRPTSYRIGRSSNKYATWRVDLAGYDAARRSSPAVVVDSSPGAGVGVFAARRVEEGATLTEWIGCLAPAPETACDELDLHQSYYGKDWRSFAQRYEIGLSGSTIIDAAGLPDGGDVRLESGRAERRADACSVDDKNCVLDYGESEFLLLGKTLEMGACASEGVAQLVNDHTRLAAPPSRDPTKSFASLRSAATLTPDGALTPRDVDGFVLTMGGVPVGADEPALREAIEHYVDRIVARNNVALVQADIGLPGDHDHMMAAEFGLAAPRIFAVATRPIAQGEELRFTYGVEWWLGQIRRAALAQLVACRPEPARAGALADLIRTLERLSREYVARQADAIAEAASMPSRYVVPLDPLPSLDEILASEDHDWQRAILAEQLALATECPVDYLRFQKKERPLEETPRP